MTTEQAIITTLGAVIVALVSYIGIRHTSKTTQAVGSGQATATKFGVFLTSLVNRLQVVEEHQAKCEADLEQARRDAHVARMDVLELRKIIDRMKSAMDAAGILFE